MIGFEERLPRCTRTLTLRSLPASLTASGTSTSSRTGVAASTLARLSSNSTTFASGSAENPRPWIAARCPTRTRAGSIASSRTAPRMRQEASATRTATAPTPIAAAFSQVPAPRALRGRTGRGSSLGRGRAGCRGGRTGRRRGVPRRGRSGRHLRSARGRRRLPRMTDGGSRSCRGRRRRLRRRRRQRSCSGRASDRARGSRRSSGGWRSGRWRGSSRWCGGLRRRSGRCARACRSRARSSAGSCGLCRTLRCGQRRSRRRGRPPERLRTAGRRCGRRRRRGSGCRRRRRQRRDRRQRLLAGHRLGGIGDEELVSSCGACRGLRRECREHDRARELGRRLADRPCVVRHAGQHARLAERRSGHRGGRRRWAGRWRHCGTARRASRRRTRPRGLRRCFGRDEEGILRVVRTRRDRRPVRRLVGRRRQDLAPRLEAALDADALGLVRGPQPQHVPFAEHGLLLDAHGVDVEAARRARVPRHRLAQLRPDAGVDGADRRQIDAELAIGIGTDQDLAHDVHDVVAPSVESASDHGQRSKAQPLVGHRCGL